MDLLAQFEIEKRVGITIVSEPYHVPDDCTWSQNTRQTVAIYWNSQCLEEVVTPIRQGRYSVAVKCKNFAVIACYISPNVSDCEYSRFLNELDITLEELEFRRIIIAGDFNAKDRLWGACITDNRGEKVSRWAACKDLRILNDGITPTCVRYGGSWGFNCRFYLDNNGYTQLDS